LKRGLLLINPYFIEAQFTLGFKAPNRYNCAP
jgi:hypothetical protein